MKKLNLLSGIIIGAGFCLLISANSKTTSLNEDIPRYHIMSMGSAIIFVYDSSTSEYKEVSLKELRNGQNIKTLLGK